MASWSSARRQPSATSSSSTSFRPPSVSEEIRIEIEDGSSLRRPMLNFNTSNDALCFTTVSKTTLRICESMRWPSASTTSLKAAGVCMSGKDRQGQRRLHVVVALCDLGDRAFQHRLGTLFERRDKRQPVAPEL